MVYVNNAVKPEAFCDFDKHRRVVDEDGLRCSRLSEVEREPKDSNVGFAYVDEAGRDERVHKLVELERPDAIRIQFTTLIANDNYLEVIRRLEFDNEFNHHRVRLRLSEHEVAKLSSRERLLLVKDDPAEVILKGESAFFVRLEDQTMPFVQVTPRQLEMLCRPLAR
ncbi:MAG: hypothetical protein ABI748_01890 [Dokdonella sp.]